MANHLRVLLIEDSEIDALVLLKELERGGFAPDHTRVETAEALQAELENHSWDVIISDYYMPDFSGLEALQVLQDKGLDIPFIMVSGKMGEDFAVEAMRSGVQDYIVKGNLSRLNPAIRREIREARIRRERKRAQEALRESEERFKATFEQAAVGIAHLGMDGRFLRVNSKFGEIVGYTEKELFTLSIQQLNHPKDIAKDSDQLTRIKRGSLKTYSIEKRFLRKDRTQVWVNLTVSGVQSESGDSKYLIMVIEDISLRKKSERALKESERKFRFVFEGASIGIGLIDLEGKIVKCNFSLSSLLGYMEDELVGVSLTDFTHPEDLVSELQLQNRLLSGQLEQYQLEKRFFRKDGQMMWGRLNVTLIYDDLERPQFILSIVEDITERKYAEEKIQYMALYDAVTDLPNRTLFFDRLHQAVSRAHRNRYIFALMYIDLDHFKPINDMYGHSAGDKVLREVALRLKQSIRQTDTACRLGGDEFAIILQDIQEVSFAEKIAQKIISSIKMPFIVNEQRCFLSASIGISFYPFDAEDVDTLLKNADSAMYKVKKSTRNDYYLFSNKSPV